MPVELRTLRKFEDITYEPSREEAAPTPHPRQDRTGQDSYSQHACLSTYPSRKGRGPFRMHRGDTGTELQEVQRYR